MRLHVELVLIAQGGGEAAARAEDWWEQVPEPVWGLITVAFSVGLSAWVAGRRAKTEASRTLALRETDEIYAPLLEGLNRVRVALQDRAFPVAFYYGGQSPNHETPGHIDLSWWGRMRDRGAHLKLDESIRGRVEQLEEKCRDYDIARKDAHVEVCKALGTAFQAAGYGDWVPDLTDQLIANEDFEVDARSLKTDETGADTAESIAKEVGEDIREVHLCRKIASELPILTSKLIDVTERHIAETRRSVISK